MRDLDLKLGLAGYLLVVFLLYYLTSCSPVAWHAPQRLPDDTLALSMPGGKVKADVVNITYQLGNHNTAIPTSTDNRQAGKKGNAATGDGSTATSTSASTPWLLYGLLIVLGIAGGWLLRGWLSRLSLLAWTGK